MVLVDINSLVYRLVKPRTNGVKSQDKVYESFIFWGVRKTTRFRREKRKRKKERKKYTIHV